MDFRAVRGESQGSGTMRARSKKPFAANESAGAYWDSVIRQWEAAHPDRLWRAYSDALNSDLFSRLLPTQAVQRLLKTDLFDEAVSDGLYPLLRTRAGDVIGIDLARQTVRTAQTRLDDRGVTCADVRCLPFADESFDVIVSNSTLDHFPSLDQLVESVRELHRVLRPTGRLLLTLDNMANPLIALRNTLPFPLLRHLGLVPYFVGATCGPGRLRRILSEVGFEVLEMNAFLHCPRVLAIQVARILETRTGGAGQQRFLRGLMNFERLASWPSRFLTGHFLAATATRPARNRSRAIAESELGT